MKGKIIVIEGADGSGKATQSALLAERLKKEKRKVIVQSFPNNPSLSSGPARMYLQSKLSTDPFALDPYQISALFAVDRLCTMQQLKKEYENGTIIILDRYVSSNKIHQGAKIESDSERKKFIDWVDNFEFGILELPKPDLTIFLDVPVFISKEIKESKQKEREKKDINLKDPTHYKRSHDLGIMLAEKYKWEQIRCVNNHGERLSQEDIHSKIMGAVLPVLDR